MKIIKKTNVWWGFTHSTSTDVGFNLGSLHRIHHCCHGLLCGQPVAVVTSPCHVTDIVDGTEHKWHRTEHSQTTTRWTYSKVVTMSIYLQFLFGNSETLAQKMDVQNLTLSQMTNFRLFQTERVCRWQFQIWWKLQNVFQMSRKHSGKKRNCKLQAIDL